MARSSTKHTRCGPLLAVEMSKKCTPLWREARFEVKMLKAPGVRTTFGSFDVENPEVKMHKVGQLRSTFKDLRCRKSARRCGAKHISKSKCAKHVSFGALLGIQMSKKCTPFLREAHSEVKNVQSTPFSEHVLKLGCGFVLQAQGIGHLVKSEKNVRVLSHFQKQLQACDICRGSAKMHFPWQAQYKQETCS